MKQKRNAYFFKKVLSDKRESNVEREHFILDKLKFRAQKTRLMNKKSITKQQTKQLLNLGTF